MQGNKPKIQISFRVFLLLTLEAISQVERISNECDAKMEFEYFSVPRTNKYKARKSMRNVPRWLLLVYQLTNHRMDLIVVSRISIFPIFLSIHVALSRHDSIQFIQCIAFKFRFIILKSSIIYISV